MKLARLLIFHISIHINSMTKCIFISTVWLFCVFIFFNGLTKCLDGRAARPAFQDFRVKFRKYEVHRRSSTRWQIDLGQSFFFQSLTHYMMRDLVMNKTSKTIIFLGQSCHLLCCLSIQPWKHILYMGKSSYVFRNYILKNIAKGTTDPRVEFCLPK